MAEKAPSRRRAPRCGRRKSGEKEPRRFLQGVEQERGCRQCLLPVRSTWWRRYCRADLAHVAIAGEPSQQQARTESSEQIARCEAARLDQESKSNMTTQLNGLRPDRKLQRTRPSERQPEGSRPPRPSYPMCQELKYGSSRPSRDPFDDERTLVTMTSTEARNRRPTQQAARNRSDKKAANDRGAEPGPRFAGQERDRQASITRGPA